MARAPIDVRLDTEVTADLARAAGAEVVIAALGSRPVPPDIPGIGRANVLRARAAPRAGN